MDIWEQVEKQYPDIHAVLDNIYNHQLVLLDMMDDLDEHYPVEGYEWEYNPNAMGSGRNPWGLRSKKSIEESLTRTDTALAKQRVCVAGTHMFKIMGPVKWCKYCGTIRVNDKTFYPEHPHFLPKEDCNG